MICQRPFPRYIVAGGFFLTVVGQTLVARAGAELTVASTKELSQATSVAGPSPSSASSGRERESTWCGISRALRKRGQHLPLSGASAELASGSYLRDDGSKFPVRPCSELGQGACSSPGRPLMVRSAGSTGRRTIREAARGSARPTMSKMLKTAS